MAVANTKSTIVGNHDAATKIPTSNLIEGCRAKEQVATVEVAAADDDNSVYRLFRVHSSWRVTKLEIANDAITNGTAYDIGLYDTADNGGAVVASKQQLWASAVDLSSAHGLTDYTYEATATNIDKIEKRVWELAGLSADPKKEYDIALTGTTVGTAAGTISGVCRYVDGS